MNKIVYLNKYYVFSYYQNYPNKTFLSNVVSYDGNCIFLGMIYETNLYNLIKKFDESETYYYKNI